MTQWYPLLALDLQNLWNLRLIFGSDASLVRGRFFHTRSNEKKCRKMNGFHIQKCLVTKAGTDGNYRTGFEHRKGLSLLFDYRKCPTCYSAPGPFYPFLNASKAQALTPRLFSCLIFSAAFHKEDDFTFIKYNIFFKPLRYIFFAKCLSRVHLKKLPCVIYSNLSSFYIATSWWLTCDVCMEPVSVP